MKHVTDQNLLLLTHRALGPIRSGVARVHLMACADCRRRQQELLSLSVATAAAFRIGMPAWRPIGVAIGVKLLAGVAVLATGILFTEMVVGSHNPYGYPSSAVQAGSVHRKILVRKSTAGPWRNDPPILQRIK